MLSSIVARAFRCRELSGDWFDSNEVTTEAERDRDWLLREYVSWRPSDSAPCYTPLLVIADGRYRIASQSGRNGEWHDTYTSELLTNVTKWRHLPPC